MNANHLLSAGVTTAVDMGSAGYANFAAMYDCDLAGKRLRIKKFFKSITDWSTWKGDP